MKTITLMMILALSACSTLKKDDCAGMDWKKKGLEDGRDGEVSNEFKKYEEQCSAHGIKASKDKYLEGYNEGVKDFCTYDNGFNAGNADSFKAHHCDEINDKYSDGYEAGHEHFKQRKHHEEESQRLQDSTKKDDCCFHRGADGTCFHGQPGCI